MTTAAPDDFALSVGFTNDMILQRGAQTAIYGLTPTTTAKVSVVVSDDSGGVQPATYHAVVTPPASAAAPPLAPGSGTSNPLCDQRCLAAGHCCQGDTSGCNKPSCAMGCILAGRTASAAACKASCADAAKGACTYEVVSPAGPHHLPQDKLQNESFGMCSGGTNSFLVDFNSGGISPTGQSANPVAGPMRRIAASASRAVTSAIRPQRRPRYGRPSSQSTRDQVARTRSRSPLPTPRRPSCSSASPTGEWSCVLRPCASSASSPLSAYTQR